MDKLRAAVASDAEAVEDYHHRCFENTYAPQLRAGELRAPDRDGTREQLRSWFQQDSAFATQVVEVDGVAIAHFTVRGNQLVHLFVAPEHHGTGLGGRLLALGEAQIAAAGHTDFELHTRVDNFSAISFYEAAGWTVTGRTIRNVEHGITYDEHILVKVAPERLVAD